LGSRETFLTNAEVLIFNCAALVNRGPSISLFSGSRVPILVDGAYSGLFGARVGILSLLLSIFRFLFSSL
jgi:hypothetical protein